MTIENNISDRKAAETLHAMVGEILKKEIGKLPSPQSRSMFFGLMNASITKNLPDQKPPEKPRTKPEPLMSSVQDAIEIANEINRLTGEICPAGQDFADSVSEKAIDITQAVTNAGQATDGQIDALENMLEGLQKWFHD